MISLPPGFDYSLLISDLFTFILPFASVSALFAAYRLIMKSFSSI